MIKVSIIGSGNVAQHLIAAFAKSNNTTLVQVFARKPESVTHLVPTEKTTTGLEALAEADIYIIAVSDSAIAEVSRNIAFTGRLVVHTSGSIAMEALDDKNRRGVFYPLQTFTKNKTVNFREIPMCLEAETAADYTILEQAAKAISDHIYPVGTQQRKALHVAAVFVNNFTNHLYRIGDAICTENHIPFDILKPLIAETANKVMTLTPEQAQTGPAKRNDQNTIESHLNFLTDQNQKDIYNILTQSIINDGKKL